MQWRIVMVVNLIAVFLIAGACMPVERPESNPPVEGVEPIERRAKMPVEIVGLLDRGCRNCHSNDTKWPWYSRVPPASWMIAKDVENARKAMNLSEWPVSEPGRAAGVLLAACADVQSGRMPLAGYRAMHPESRWTKAETKTFCDWVNGESRRLLANGKTSGGEAR